MTKTLDKRVGFAVSEAERIALRMMAIDEDSEASLLRSLIRDEARRRGIWSSAQRKALIVTE